MSKNKELILVTDKIRDYNLLLKTIPFPERMIVEVFSVTEYKNAVKSGVKYPAYCIWNRRDYKKAVKYNFPIVTMNANRFFQKQKNIDLVQQLHDNKVTILLFYTSFPDRDNPEFIKRFLGKTVSKIYTDKWSPSRLPQ